MGSRVGAVVNSWDGEAPEVNAAYCAVSQVRVRHSSKQVVGAQCGWLRQICAHLLRFVIARCEKGLQKNCRNERHPPGWSWW